MKFKVRIAFSFAFVTVIYILMTIFQSGILDERDEYARKETNLVTQTPKTQNLFGDAQRRATEFIDVYDLNWTNPGNYSRLWDIAGSWVNPRYIHPPRAVAMGAILTAMATAKITHADFGRKGTQLKLLLSLEGNQLVSFKPKWFAREHVIMGKPYDGADRHNGEIAAFHLNRLLGYNKSPLVVGRVLDLKNEILPVARKELVETFFTKDNNTCFYGRCYYCKSEADGVCAEGSHLEGALVLWLPEKWQFKKWRSPWQRTYKDGKQAQWEVDEKYCDKVETFWPYSSGPRLLDLLDAVVMDHLIGNADRHHYETFANDNNSMIVLLDNAKSFGNAFVDEMSILAPLRQCCRLRAGTYQRLRDLQGSVLSTVLRRLLQQEPISPILSEAHYIAMDRRLEQILDTIQTCYLRGRLKLEEDGYS